MRDLTQKIGYLKGLRDSLGADPNEPANRLTNLMIDVLDGLTETVDELINEHQELNDYVSSIDDDLADLESRSKSGDFPGDDFDEDDMESAPHTRGHLRVLKPDAGKEDEEEDEPPLLERCSVKFAVMVVFSVMVNVCVAPPETFSPFTVQPLKS